MNNSGKIVVLAVLLFCLGYVGYDYCEYLTQTKSYSLSTGAKILIIKNPNPSGYWRIATYEYSVSGIKYTTTQNLNLSVSHRPFMKEGDTIAIIYDPKKPQNVSALESADFFVWFGILLIVIIVLLYDIFKNWEIIKRELKNFW